MKQIRHRFSFPIFLFIYALYIIFISKGLPDNWLWWGLGAFIIDIIMNPLTETVEVSAE